MTTNTSALPAGVPDVSLPYRELSSNGSHGHWSETLEKPLRWRKARRVFVCCAMRGLGDGEAAVGRLGAGAQQALAHGLEHEGTPAPSPAPGAPRGIADDGAAGGHATMATPESPAARLTRTWAPADDLGVAS